MNIQTNVSDAAGQLYSVNPEPFSFDQGSIENGRVLLFYWEPWKTSYLSSVGICDVDQCVQQYFNCNNELFVCSCFQLLQQCVEASICKQGYYFNEWMRMCHEGKYVHNCTDLQCKRVELNLQKMIINLDYNGLVRICFNFQVLTGSFYSLKDSSKI